MGDEGQGPPSPSPERTSLPPATHDAVRESADARLREIESSVAMDTITILSPIQHGLEHRVRMVIDGREGKRDSLLVILDTVGGVVEVVERIARVLRENYSEVHFLIPDRAMSAGTVLAMSGDSIMMDYHSCLGPIDPQIERDGTLVPALSYLAKFDELVDKSKKGNLSTPEVVLLQKLDLAELHRFELARDLSIELLKDWLTTFKFKDWKVTETQGLEVTREMKAKRAEEIAAKLSDHQRWRSHGRGISRDVLIQDLNLKIDDFGEDEEFRKLVWDYFWFLRDYMGNFGMTSFVHSLNYF